MSDKAAAYLRCNNKTKKVTVNGNHTAKQGFIKIII